MRRFCFLLRAATALLAGPAFAATVPKSVILLFDGRSLDAFETWVPLHGDQDPDRVFSVVDRIDGSPAIRISGQHWGGLLTREAFRDYRLVVEFRWGSPTWGDRQTRGRDSGILLHCQGEPGNHRPDRTSPWMQSIEYQLMEGATGDMIIVPGHDRPDGPRLFPSVKIKTDGPDARVWNPRGLPHTFMQGRIAWYGRDPQWRDELGFRGRQDMEAPIGQWNRVEIVAAGNELDYYLNGNRVNRIEACSLSEGKLLFQSEGSEVYLRRIELHSLPLSGIR